MANKTLVDAIRQIIGSKGDIAESVDGVWYDIFKRPNLSVNSNISHGRADGGVVKYLSDIKDSIDTVKGDIYGSDKDNPADGTIYKDIKDKYTDVADKYNDLVVTDTNGHAGKYGDFIAKYSDFTSNDEGNPAKYEDFIAKWGVIADGSKLRDEIIRVSNDLEGKDRNGNAYGENGENDSKIKLVADNITDITKVASNEENINILAKNVDIDGDTTDPTKPVNIVAKDISKVSVVHDNIINNGPVVVLYNDMKDGSTNYIQTIGSNLGKGENSEIKIVSDNLQKANSEIKTVALDLEKTNSYIKSAFDSVSLIIEARDKAREWAESPGEIEAEDGSTGRSAKYWAEQAQEIASGGFLKDDLSSSASTYTSEKIYNLVDIAIQGAMSMADGRIIIKESAAIEPLAAGEDNELSFNIEVDTENTNSLTADATANTITFKRASSYFIGISIRFKSHVNAARNVTIKLIDGSGNVIASNRKEINIQQDKAKIYDFALPVDINNETTVKLKLHIDGDNYDMLSFKAYVFGSISRDIDLDVSNLQEELDVTQNSIGLNPDGTYAANDQTNYIANATSLKDADEKLDSAIKARKDEIDTLNGAIDKLDEKIGIINGDASINGSVDNKIKIQVLDRIIDEDDMASNADDKIPTQQSVKAYVDARVAAQNEASEITVTATGNLSSTNVQDGLEELQGDIDIINGDSGVEGSIDNKIKAQVLDKIIDEEDMASNAHDKIPTQRSVKAFASNANNITSGTLSKDRLPSEIDANTTGSAAKWTNARKITLGGDVSGSVNIDGSSDVTLNVTVKDDSHNHVIDNIDGLQDALDSKLDDSQLDTNTELGTDDTKIPSQKAVKTYIDAKVSGLANEQVTRNANALGTKDKIRYDKVLDSMNAIELVYNSDNALTVIRFEGDGGDNGPYFRNILEYDDSGKLVKIKHYYNNDSIADGDQNGTTTITYNGNNITSVTYTE